jgi:RNA polymerase sigma-70 factor (ECF subfamily)
LVVRTLLRDRTKLLAYVGVIVRDEHVAEDILQEVSLLAVRKHAQIADERHLLAWLRQAGRQLALQTLRNQRRRPKMLDQAVLDALEGHWMAQDTVQTSDRMDALRHCIEKLNDYPRRLIELRYGEGLNGAELARRVGRKVETIYVALSRAHQSLAQCVRRQLLIQSRHA